MNSNTVILKSNPNDDQAGEEGKSSKSSKHTEPVTNKKKKGKKKDKKSKKGKGPLAEAESIMGLHDIVSKTESKKEETPPKEKATPTSSSSSKSEPFFAEAKEEENNVDGISKDIEALTLQKETTTKDDKSTELPPKEVSPKGETDMTSKAGDKEKETVAPKEETLKEPEPPSQMEAKAQEKAAPPVAKALEIVSEEPPEKETVAARPLNPESDEAIVTSALNVPVSRAPRDDEIPAYSVGAPFSARRPPPAARALETVTPEPDNSEVHPDGSLPPPARRAPPRAKALEPASDTSLTPPARGPPPPPLAKFSPKPPVSNIMDDMASQRGPINTIDPYGTVQKKAFKIKDPTGGRISNKEKPPNVFDDVTSHRDPVDQDDTYGTHSTHLRRMAAMAGRTNLDNAARDPLREAHRQRQEYQRRQSDHVRDDLSSHRPPVDQFDAYGTNHLQKQAYERKVSAPKESAPPETSKEQHRSKNVLSYEDLTSRRAPLDKWDPYGTNQRLPSTDGPRRVPPPQQPEALPKGKSQGGTPRSLTTGATGSSFLDDNRGRVNTETLSNQKGYNSNPQQLSGVPKVKKSNAATGIDDPTSNRGRVSTETISNQKGYTSSTEDRRRQQPAKRRSAPARYSRAPRSFADDPTGDRSRLNVETQSNQRSYASGPDGGRKRQTPAAPRSFPGATTGPLATATSRTASGAAGATFNDDPASSRGRVDTGTHSNMKVPPPRRIDTRRTQQPATAPGNISRASGSAFLDDPTSNRGRVNVDTLSYDTHLRSLSKDEKAAQQNAFMDDEPGDFDEGSYPNEEDSGDELQLDTQQQFDDTVKDQEPSTAMENEISSEAPGLIEENTKDEVQSDGPWVDDFIPSIDTANLPSPESIEEQQDRRRRQPRRRRPITRQSDPPMQTRAGPKPYEYNDKTRFGKHIRDDLTAHRGPINVDDPYGR